MAHLTFEERGHLMDLESGPITSEEGTNQSDVLGNRHANNLLNAFANGFMGFNGSAGAGYRGTSHSNLGEPREVAAENVEVLIASNSSGGEESEEHMALVEKNHMEEKDKKANYNKTSKPPRPPKGPALDAGDMKLVKEISKMAMKKRARTERLKTLRKAKKNSSSSSSLPSSSVSSSLLSGSSLFALVFTIFFFLVILFQGFRSRGGSSMTFKGSPQPVTLATKSLISVEFYNHPSANDGSGMGS